jgi:hypothetical protein
MQKNGSDDIDNSINTPHMHNSCKGFSPHIEYILVRTPDLSIEHTSSEQVRCTHLFLVRSSLK